MKLLQDTLVLFVFYLKLSIKSPIWLAVTLFQPLCYLYFYAPLLENVIKQSGPQEQTLRIFIPGLVVMVAFFGSMFVGFALIDEIKSGVIERYRVTSVNRLALLLGRSLRDMLTLVIQSSILILLSLTIGLHINLWCAALMLLLIAFLGLFMSSISYSLSLNLKSEDAVGSIINFLAQPMLLLSGVLIPLAFAPYWLAKISSFNPLRYVVEAARSIFIGNFSEPVIIQGITILAILVVLSLFWGARSFNKDF